MADPLTEAEVAALFDEEVVLGEYEKEMEGDVEMEVEASEQSVEERKKSKGKKKRSKKSGKDEEVRMWAEASMSGGSRVGDQQGQCESESGQSGVSVKRKVDSVVTRKGEEKKQRMEDRQEEVWTGAAAVGELNMLVGVMMI